MMYKKTILVLILATVICSCTDKTNFIKSQNSYLQNCCMALSNQENNKSHLVIFLHGIGKNSSSLNKLEKFISSYNFTTFNVSYPSTENSIEEIVDIIHESILNKINDYDKVSFVGFSMGGLVVRAYLNKYHLPKLDKVVMIGTPNNGSEVSDFFEKNNFYKRLLGPAGSQLTTTFQNKHSLFGKIYYECGVIAGNLPLDFCYPIMMHSPSDGKVSVRSTKVDNMKDHIILKSPHWYLLQSKEAWIQALYFLQYSKFCHR